MIKRLICASLMFGVLATYADLSVQVDTKTKGEMKSDELVVTDVRLVGSLPEAKPCEFDTNKLAVASLGKMKFGNFSAEIEPLNPGHTNTLQSSLKFDLESVGDLYTFDFSEFNAEDIVEVGGGTAVVRRVIPLYSAVDIDKKFRRVPLSWSYYDIPYSIYFSSYDTVDYKLDRLRESLNTVMNVLRWSSVDDDNIDFGSTKIYNNDDLKEFGIKIPTVSTGFGRKDLMYIDYAGIRFWYEDTFNEAGIMLRRYTNPNTEACVFLYSDDAIPAINEMIDAALQMADEDFASGYMPQNIYDMYKRYLVFSKADAIEHVNKPTIMPMFTEWDLGFGPEDDNFGDELPILDMTLSTILPEESQTNSVVMGLPIKRWDKSDFMDDVIFIYKLEAMADRDDFIMWAHEEHPDIVTEEMVSNVVNSTSLAYKYKNTMWLDWMIDYNPHYAKYGMVASYDKIKPLLSEEERRFIEENSMEQFIETYAPRVPVMLVPTDYYSELFGMNVDEIVITNRTEGTIYERWFNSDLGWFCNIDPGIELVTIKGANVTGGDFAPDDLHHTGIFCPIFYCLYEGIGMTIIITPPAHVVLSQCPDIATTRAAPKLSLGANSPTNSYVLGSITTNSIAYKFGKKPQTRITRKGRRIVPQWRMNKRHAGWHKFSKRAKKVRAENESVFMSFDDLKSGKLNEVLKKMRERHNKKK